MHDHNTFDHVSDVSHVDLPDGWSWDTLAKSSNRLDHFFSTGYDEGGPLRGIHGTGGYSGRVCGPNGGDEELYSVVIRPIIYRSGGIAEGLPVVNKDFEDPQTAYKQVRSLIESLPEQEPQSPSPFQRRCVDRTDNRIILQSRSDSVSTQALLAAVRTQEGGSFLHLAPSEVAREAFLDELPTHVDPEARGIQSFVVGDSMIRGRDANVVVVDQPQYVHSEDFREAYLPRKGASPDTEWVLAPTGRSGAHERSALDYAIETGEFSLLRMSMIEQPVDKDQHTSPFLDSYNQACKEITEARQGIELTKTIPHSP